MKKPSTKEALVNKRIGKTIARKRKIAGFTQQEVAEHFIMGNEAFSRIERGLVIDAEADRDAAGALRVARCRHHDIAAFGPDRRRRGRRWR